MLYLHVYSSQHRNKVVGQVCWASFTTTIYNINIIHVYRRTYSHLPSQYRPTASSSTWRRARYTQDLRQAAGNTPIMARYKYNTYNTCNTYNTYNTYNTKKSITEESFCLYFCYTLLVVSLQVTIVIVSIVP